MFLSKSQKFKIIISEATQEKNIFKITVIKSFNIGIILSSKKGI